MPKWGNLGLIKSGVQFLMLPGALVGLSFDRGVHDVKIWPIESVNVALYSGLFYWSGRILRKADVALASNRSNQLIRLAGGRPMATER